MSTLAQNFVPSLRTRQPSPSNLPVVSAMRSARAGRPVAAILLRIELGEMPADDLLRAIALDALGAGIPGNDEPGGVQHEDRAVADPLDQPLEVLGAVFEGRSVPGLSSGPGSGIVAYHACLDSVRGVNDQFRGHEPSSTFRGGRGFAVT